MNITELFNLKLITKRNLSIFGLLIFCTLIGLMIIDTIIWHSDGGPKYTHDMWYQDRLDRINEDDKLRIQIIELRNEINELKTIISELNNQ